MLPPPLETPCPSWFQQEGWWQWQHFCKTPGREKTEKNFLVQVHANKSLYIKPVKKITYLPRSLLPHIHI
ncbi:hypothetical protein D3Z46_16340 [Bacteroides sartorii]|nr:hypothetical protein [Phocaeicola sartorii]